MNHKDKKTADLGLPAGEWLNIFRGAKVEVERLDAAKSAHGRATVIGNFLARMVDRQVPIEVDGRTGKATLRSAQGRSRKQLYYFEVIFNDEGEADSREGNNPQPPRKINASSDKRPEKEQKNNAKPRNEVRENPIDRRTSPNLVPTGNDEAW